MGSIFFSSVSWLGSTRNQLRLRMQAFSWRRQLYWNGLFSNGRDACLRHFQLFMPIVFIHGESPDDQRVSASWDAFLRSALWPEILKSQNSQIHNPTWYPYLIYEGNYRHFQESIGSPAQFSSKDFH
jgi:hypothetical protein